MSDREEAQGQLWDVYGLLHKLVDKVPDVTYQRGVQMAMNALYSVYADQFGPCPPKKKTRK